MIYFAQLRNTRFWQYDSSLTGAKEEGAVAADEECRCCDEGEEWEILLWNGEDGRVGDGGFTACELHGLLSGFFGDGGIGCHDLLVMFGGINQSAGSR